MRVLGNMSIKQLIFNDVEEIVLPADILVDSTNSDVEAPQDPRFQIARGMDDLVTRTADVRLFGTSKENLLTAKGLPRHSCYTVYE